MSSVPPIITVPPPPPPPPQNPQLAPIDLNAWYWEAGYRAGYMAAADKSPLYAVKRWWKSKLMWIGKITALFGAGLEYLQGQESNVVAAFGKYGPHAFLAIGLTVMFLRLRTRAGLTK